MNNEIEVGEYVRNIEGKIDKVINPDYYMSQYIECEKYLMSRASIVKHSKNIIDLIELGDYVNGEKIEQITTDSGYKKYYTTGFGLYDEYDNENVIHSILTKEQYEANSYKLKED